MDPRRCTKSVNGVPSAVFLIGKGCSDEDEYDSCGIAANDSGQGLAIAKGREFIVKWASSDVMNLHDPATKELKASIVCVHSWGFPSTALPMSLDKYSLTTDQLGKILGAKLTPPQLPKVYINYQQDQAPPVEPSSVNLAI